MQKITLLCLAVLIATTSFAKIWRVNNNPGVIADFTTFTAVIQSASVVAGDTVHIEPSATNYVTGSLTLAKRLVVIGVGYFLNPSDATYPGNTGLQFATASSSLQQFGIDAGAAGSKFMGLHMAGGLLIYASASPLNLTFEKLFFTSAQIAFYSNGALNNSDGITVRKCFFNGGGVVTNGSAPTVSNLTIENCIFYPGMISLANLTGAGNVIRNNSWYTATQVNTVSNAYVANNIFGTSSTNNTFTNCTIKNNLFSSPQTLPGTATNNQVSVNMNNVHIGGTTGSLDSRVALKAGSPAIAAGVTIAGYTPDAGAYGATDPYKLSGIPAVPSIYSLTVPTSIPTGSATMNVTFSSRNNN